MASSDTMETYCTLGRSEHQSNLKVICKGSLYDRSVLQAEDIRLIRIRSGVQKKKKQICDAHIKKDMTRYASNQRLCCNPLSYHQNAATTPKGATEITMDLREKGKLKGLKLIPGRKMCVQCKFAVYKTVKEGVQVVVDSSPSLPSSQVKSDSPATPGFLGTPPNQPQHQDSPQAPYMVNLEKLNDFLITHQQEPIDLNKLKHQRDYSVDQLDRVKQILDCAKGGLSEDPVQPQEESVHSWVSESSAFDEVLNQLQDYFESCKSKADKVRSLTVLPRSWAVSKVQKHFKAFVRMIKKAKRLVDEKGILTSPNKKFGKRLKEETTQAVINFFYQSDVSKELTGKNNFISVKVDGKREHRMKRLVLANLCHLHTEFLAKHPNHKISLSKFAFLRPRDCILADDSGMHNVCVCIIHQNPKLMFEGAKFKQMTNFGKVTDCLNCLVCTTPTDDCFLRICKFCPDSTELREKLEVAFDDEIVETVTYNQWESTDRGEILTKSSPVEEFIDDFLPKLEDLLTHHFTFKEQSSFFTELKENLEENEAVIVGDFAENYSFVVQDSVQSFYFTNRQATIHPFSVYFRNPATDSVEQISFSVISDHMDHSTVAVYDFQKELLAVLKEKYIPELSSVYWCLDGCAGQYKNKNNASNVWFHYKDFRIKAQWHYFATGHGRSTCDGIGGSIKRMATLYCLKHTEPGSLITTPKKLYDWAVQGGISKVHCIWVPTDVVENAQNFLEVRFTVAKPLDGIRSAHAIVPCEGKNFVTLKKISRAAEGEEHEIVVSELGVRFDDVKGYVTVCLEDETNWRLAYVQEKNKSNASVMLALLTKRIDGKKDKNEYEFAEENASWYSVDCILTLAQPRIMSKGRIMKMLKADVTTADIVLKNKIKIQVS